MRKITKIILVLLFITIITDCSKEIPKHKDKEISFDQIGYYKGDNKLRYFTFYINTKEVIERENISDELIDLIKDHGSKQMHTDGRVTASFYYINEKDTPDITLLSAEQANTIAHEKHPLISVWIMPSGEVNVFKNPE